MKVQTRTSSFLFLLAFCAVSNAGTIAIHSQPGLANSITTATVAITPHSLWQSNNPVNPMGADDASAVWISCAPNGYGDSTFQPYNGLTPVVTIFHSFNSSAGYLNLNVWADDTAQVLLDGNSIFAPVFTQSTCSGQPIGCLPDDVGQIHADFGSGSHALEFRLSQVGTGGNTASNPFGLPYTGGAFSPFQTNIPTQTPEPGTLALGGARAVLAGIALRLRRRGQSPEQ